MVGFCLSGDLFNLFVFFELMSVSAYALTGYDVDEGAALEGSLNFAVTNTIGSFLLLIGIALLYARTGALNIAQIGARRSRMAAPTGWWSVALAFLVCGFLVKAAIVPFHFWLADAYAVAPTAGLHPAGGRDERARAPRRGARRVRRVRRPGARSTPTPIRAGVRRSPGC